LSVDVYRKGNLVLEKALIIFKYLEILRRGDYPCGDLLNVRVETMTEGLFMFIVL